MATVKQLKETLTLAHQLENHLLNSWQEGLITLNEYRQKSDVIFNHRFNSVLIQSMASLWFP